MSDETDRDREIIEEAKKNFTRAQDWEASSRALGDQDEKFGNADSDNGWQWDTTLKGDREADNLPCLTINKTRQHCLQIINEARDHEDGVQVRPVGGGATFDAAQVFEGLIRHIEYVSNAQQAYDTGSWNQVFAGIGYWRIVTEFLDDSFDQEIYIRRVPDRHSVYLDCDIKEYDGSDARWGIVFEDVPRKLAEEQGLVDKDAAQSVSTLGNTGNDWNTKDHVRVAEYFRRSDKADELIELPPAAAAKFGRSSMRVSEFPAELRAAIPKTLRRRKITTPEIEWFKIVGDEIKDRKPWLGKYIPIIRIVGEETVIDGILDRKGHVRALKDPQRMYNYNSSAAVQYGALQSKAPWLAPVEAIGNHMPYWSAANIAAGAVLPYNGVTEEGKEIPAPKRIEPPQAAPVFLEGMKIAESEMMLVSGQYQAVMGSPSNETSGKAINARQRQGDNATGHYLQHRATAIRLTGKQLIDLIPKVYDTARVRQIIARDGTRKSVQIDPSAPAAHAPVGEENDKDADNDAITAIFNPTVGAYDVMSDVGPSYATARQEAFNALSTIITNNKEAFAILGDLWLDSADFPTADKAKERLRNMVPPQATGGPSKEMQAMQAHMQAAAQAGQQQIEQLSHALQETQQKLAEKGPSELDWYKAETDRMKAVGAIDPAAMQPVIRGLVSDALGTPIVPVMHAHAAAELAMQPPEPQPTQESANGQ